MCKYFGMFQFILLVYKTRYEMSYIDDQFHQKADTTDNLCEKWREIRGL